jgi:hypothetical protein
MKLWYEADPVLALVRANSPLIQAIHYAGVAVVNTVNRCEATALVSAVSISPLPAFLRMQDFTGDGTSLGRSLH